MTSFDPRRALVWSEVEQIVRLESRVNQLLETQEEIDGSVDELQNLAVQWVELKTELNGVNAADLSTLDVQKISSFQDRVRELLSSFGFRSFGTREIALANDDFRPQVEKQEEDGERVVRNLGFEASASDGIRLKWAYYLALIEVSQRYRMNHVGMVIFDEPGQQQMKDVDLSTFLAQAARSVEQEGQVVVSTSENIERVRDSLKGSTAIVHNFDGFMIQPVP